MAGLLSNILSENLGKQADWQAQVNQYGSGLKSKLMGLLQDPAGSLNQFVGHLGEQTDRNSALMQQTGWAPTVYGKSTATPEQSALARALMAEQGTNAAMAGATVYHASPFKFDKLSTSNPRGGEGAASYGHGLYLAESPEVSGVGGKYFEQFKKHEAAAEQGGPFSYKVDLPDEHIAKMLDWDKPLSQQHPDVRKAVTSLAQSNPEVMDAIKKGGMGDMKGNLLYASLQDLYTGNAKRSALLKGENPASWTRDDIARLADGNDAWASSQLHQSGIPGIKYLDQVSRAANPSGQVSGGASAMNGARPALNELSSNFVVFPGNEGLLKIQERNGQPLGLLK